MAGSAGNDFLTAVMVAAIGGFFTIIAAIIYVVGPLLVEQFRRRHDSTRILLPNGVTVRPKLRSLISAKWIATYLLASLFCGTIAYVSSNQSRSSVSLTPPPTKRSSTLVANPSRTPGDSLGTQAISRTSPATLSASSSPTPSPTFTLTPTLDPYTSQGECDLLSPVPPCTYVVRVDDYASLIAKKIYGDLALGVLILNFNRTSDGSYPALHRGDILYIPPKDPPPPIRYPKCTKGGEFPCQYSALERDTYAIIAQEIYGNIKAAEAIKAVNWEYDADNNAFVPIPEPLREGTILILPVWR